MLIFNSKAVVERRGFRPKIFDENLAQGHYSDRTTKQDQPSIIGHGGR